MNLEVLRLNAETHGTLPENVHYIYQLLFSIKSFILIYFMLILCSLLFEKVITL